MAARNPRNLVLTGISTSGKSTVGRQLSERLGMTFVDLDLSIERAAGHTISEIFSYEGEKGFRDLETAELRRALSAGRSVISTGGGVVLRKENRQLIEAESIVICLDARAETVFLRLGGGRPRRPGRPIRPLLDGPNPMERITDMKRERAYWYSLADWTIHTDMLRVAEVVKEAEHAWTALVPRLEELPLRNIPDVQQAPVVSTPGGSYPLYVGSGVLDGIGSRLREHGLIGRAFVLADEHAATFHGRRLLDSLASAGLSGDIFTIPSGDQSKDLGLARRIYDWLGERKAERRETVVAFGGGVAGDLGGFVAATWLRGVPLVQVPTTLLAMTDSSIGGKVGVNLPFGKNLVGAFYQPRFVLADVETLSSLGRREVVAGWAETVKHGLIRDLDLLERLERGADQLLNLDQSLLVDVIRRSSAVKANVVSSDEREDGLRMLLNYGHTIGHALEAAGDYQKLLHGEAVAIGMAGAAGIARELGLLSDRDVVRQARVIARFGLPKKSGAVPMEKISSALAMDKKVQSKKLRWIFLDGIGNAITREDVSIELVERTIQDLIE